MNTSHRFVSLPAIATPAPRRGLGSGCMLVAAPLGAVLWGDQLLSDSYVASTVIVCSGIVASRR